MDQPVKPFACGILDCGMSFTNEDHLHVHRKKHDMVLQLGIEQKTAFVADQTPTPTRFIRNCEEVGLFQELQNVNPFDEGFKKAMETRQENMLDAPTLTPSTDDVLHTPQNIFPNHIETTDTTYYTSTNIQKNLSITTQSSHDETGNKMSAKITKLLNEVTNNKIIVIDSVSLSKDVNETVSYTNNIVKVNSENKKSDNEQELLYSVSITRDQVLNDNSKIKAPLIISQKSLDQVVDSLNSDVLNNLENNIKEHQKAKKVSVNTTNNESVDNTSKRKKIDEDISDSTEDYEVVIKFPTGKRVRLKAVEEDLKTCKLKELETKQKLKQVITEKKDASKNMIASRGINMLPKGTLIPVTLFNTSKIILPKVSQKIAIPQLINTNEINQTKKVDSIEPIRISVKTEKVTSKPQNVLPQASKTKTVDRVDYKIRRQMVAQRYRKRVKLKQEALTDQIAKQGAQLKRLTHENAVLKSLLIEHIQKCPQADDLRNSVVLVETATD